MKYFKYIAVLVISLVLLVISGENAFAGTVQKCGSFTVNVKENSTALVPTTQIPKISNLKIAHVSPEESCVVVSWQTNIPATSQVVYAKVSDKPSINATKPNLGYTYASAQNNSGDTVHFAIINNVDLNEKYQFQVVSKAHISSVPVVSVPVKFVLVYKPAQIKPAKPANPAPAYKPVAKAPVYKPVPAPKPVAKPAQVIQNKDTVSAGQSVTTGVAKVAKPVVKSKQVTSECAPETSLKQPEIIITKIVEVVPAVIPKPVGEPVYNRIHSGFPKDTTPPSSDEFAAISLYRQVQKQLTKPQLKPHSVGMPANNVDINTQPKQGYDLSGFYSLLARLSFLVPVLLIIGFVYLLEKVLLPFFGIIVEKPRVFFVFATLLFAIAAFITNWFKVSFVLFAIALVAIAWHLLSNLVEQDSLENEDGNSKNDAHSHHASSNTNVDAEENTPTGSSNAQVAHVAEQKSDDQDKHKTYAAESSDTIAENVQTKEPQIDSSRFPEYVGQLRDLGEDVDTKLLDWIINYIGSANYDRDGKYVSCSDKNELEQVYQNFVLPVLGEADKQNAMEAIQQVCDKMSDYTFKYTAVFYYLLAKHYGLKI